MGINVEKKKISYLPTKKKISKLAAGFSLTKANVRRLECSVSQLLREMMHVLRIPAHLMPWIYTVLQGITSSQEPPPPTVCQTHL